MEPCDLNEEPPKCTFSDLRGPAPKVSKGPVHLQLHNLLRDNIGAVMSPGGQTFAFVPNQFGSFNVPVHSNFLKSWLVERHIARGNPLPAKEQLTEVLQAFESRAIAGTSSGGPAAMTETSSKAMGIARVPTLAKRNSGTNRDAWRKRRPSMKLT